MQQPSPQRSRPKACAGTPGGLHHSGHLVPSPATVTAAIRCAASYYSDFHKAWALEHPLCEATVTGKVMTEAEKHAVQTAYGSTDKTSSLGTLYGMCAQNSPDSWSYLATAGSPEQVAEVTGALTLCPDHPQKDKITKLLAQAGQQNKLRSEGKIFGSGILLVGTEVKAGTYYTTDVKNCYWERTNSNGQIIDNYFTNAAKRVQVTIRAGDYSFNSEHCGEWKPLDQ
ncbi:hypothetical protein ACFXB3_28130 [Streptomyces sp. NPDC059447]|uniref:hypothetical protein n=1 Tax=Streptomyces sp. NPDC059447 TaxID=3346834 RepID=UPI003681D8F3